MLPRRRKDGDALAALQNEMREEAAASLGRVGRKLEERLASLAQLAAELATLEGAARAPVLATYRAVRAEAAEYRWYLQVQREALGLRNHDAMFRLYPLPPPILE